MSSTAPLSSIKTLDQLLTLLVSEGWSKSPTKEPFPWRNCLTYSGNPPINPPCWVTSDEIHNILSGSTRIALHPGIYKNHGEFQVNCVAENGVIRDWYMSECLGGTVDELDADKTSLRDLKQLLNDWIKSLEEA